MVLGGCGSDGPGQTGTEPLGDALLDPPPVGQGFQYRMQTSIVPAYEGELCKFVMGPDEDFYLSYDQVKFTPGSHHFLLYQTAYSEIPTQNNDGEPVDTSSVFDCSAGATAGWSIARLLGGSQTGDGTALSRFPDNVAMKVPGHTVLLMNAHYINASSEALEPEVAINLWTAPGDQVTEEGDILFLYNPFIKVGANGTGRARWRCPVLGDITVGSIQSHMHKRGVGFAGMLVGDAPFYENDDWDNVPVKDFGVGMPVSKGQAFDYYCDYQNSEGHDIYQGPRTTDEMCMLIGPYWPANVNQSNCLDDKGNLAGEWVGNGATTCTDTWACIVDTFDKDDVVSRIADCIDAADPAISAEVSAALNCVIKEQALEGCEAPIAACNAK